MGAAFGGRVVAAKEIRHGKTSAIMHDGTGIFEGLPSPFTATRYHSLAIDPAAVPNVLRVTARTSDGEIMGVAHAERPVHGVQFHPESIASEHGHRLLANFLAIAGIQTVPLDTVLT
jgi:anthranilate synthase component 2